MRCVNHLRRCSWPFLLYHPSCQVGRPWWCFVQCAGRDPAVRAFQAALECPVHLSVLLCRDPCCLSDLEVQEDRQVPAQHPNEPHWRHDVNVNRVELSAELRGLKVNLHRMRRRGVVPCSTVPVRCRTAPQCNATYVVSLTHRAWMRRSAWSRGAARHRTTTNRIRCERTSTHVDIREVAEMFKTNDAALFSRIIRNIPTSMYYSITPVACQTATWYGTTLDDHDSIESNWFQSRLNLITVIILCGCGCLSTSKPTYRSMYDS